ncbi:MAG: ABC transporter substrate-binding protein [Firmicutes bacterium]|nr:ABC transporter substrate-binding protein [Bacillota bacterium]
MTATLATKDVNEWLEREGKPWRLDLKIEDTATDPPTALQKMKTWFGTGVKFFIGPYASGECKECLTFANANKILFVASSSTSPALSIPNDSLFRFCPDDLVQSPAVARTAWEAGVRHLIISWRGDTWGDGLQKGISEAFPKLGGKVYPKGIRYDPGLEDFPKEAALLNDYVNDLVRQGVPKSQIGIVLIAFEEVAPYMAAAAKYPVLKEVPWFGTDGTAHSAALQKHSVAGPFAAKARFVSTMFAPGAAEKSRFDYVKDHVQSVLNRETDAYSYNVYDMVWCLALCMDEVGYDSEKAMAILPRVTDQWTKVNGASGHVVLNEAGDRAFADYELWYLSESGEWEKIGIWRGQTDTVDWIKKIY